jgi:arginine utilization protein RocB
MQTNRLFNLLKTLVACPSTTDTAEELGMQAEIYRILSDMEYFKSNPRNLILHPIPCDRHKRASVAALVKGNGSKTVILTGHYDTADTVDYGPYREQALDIDRLTQALEHSGLDPDTLSDLTSGDWIFGRGTADMKGGLALFMYLLEYYSERADELEGNILFLAVPDEETNSSGMTGSVAFLNRLSRDRGLDYVCLIDSEPCSFNDDGSYNIYTGSIGKMLPLIYCFGREAHARDPFYGINPNLIMSEIICEIEANTALSDSYRDDIAMPPVSLKAMDLRNGYGISTPPAAACYFNMLTYRRSPAEIIAMLRNISARCLQRAFDRVNQRIDEFNSISGERIDRLDWQPKVLTFVELYQMCLEKHGDAFKNHIDEFTRAITAKNVDFRDATIDIVTEVHSFCPDRSPKIIIALAPPYYPHVTLNDGKAKDAKVLNALDKLGQYALEEFGIRLKANRFFDGISDLSYCSIRDAQDVITEFEPNMPLWGHSYFLPVDEIEQLSVPGIILGPWGKDLHKYTERLSRSFYLQTAPKLLKRLIETLLAVS